MKCDYIVNSRVGASVRLGVAFSCHVSLICPGNSFIAILQTLMTLTFLRIQIRGLFG